MAAAARGTAATGGGGRRVGKTASERAQACLYDKMTGYTRVWMTRLVRRVSHRLRVELPKLCQFRPNEGASAAGASVPPAKIVVVAVVVIVVKVGAATGAVITRRSAVPKCPAPKVGPGDSSCSLLLQELMEHTGERRQLTPHRWPPRLRATGYEHHPATQGQHAPHHLRP
uniref:Uncharacterized protein n=1 Tax=Ananas comosus var. bracteatus TaxID=296719 RepID=A0A6V7PSL0_ANACO|nr:unnamed protein product [Ananas comosus var. bracteatus]